MNFIPNEPRSARFPDAVQPEDDGEGLGDAFRSGSGDDSPTLPMLPDLPSGPLESPTE